MHGHYTLKKIRILGARLHVHWSVVAAAIVLLLALQLRPLQAALAIGCYFGIILLHEAGHAFVAKRLGYPATAIRLSFLHGSCEYEQPWTLKEDALIAWGGVLAQLAVALPLILLGRLTPLATVPYASTALAFLGHYNLLIALFNLLPIPGLDGALAWRLVPILFREVRDRAAARKMAKAVIRRVK